MVPHLKLASHATRQASRKPSLRASPHKEVRQGAVTRTQIGRAQSGGPSSGLGSGSGFPCPERFVSKDAERVAGCEMALDVEGVEDRGVNRQEALG
jgi:hypothetical protein